MQCDSFILTLGDSSYSFSSHSELAEFLMLNANRIEGFKWDPSIRFSKDFVKRDEVYAKILNMANTRPEMTITYDKDGSKVVSSRDRIGVTRAIRDPRFGNNGKALIPDMNRDEFFNTLRANDTNVKNLSDEEFAQVRESIEAYWNDLGKYGTTIHKINELYFNNNEITMEEVKSLLLADPKYKDLDEQVVNSCLNYVADVKRQLDIRYPGAKYMPEVKITTKTRDGSAELVGVIDLLVIDGDGNTHIFDFKTSPKRYEDFIQVKELTNDYQLEIYRQMLEQYGVDMDNADLGILPIQMTMEDYENARLTDIDTNALIDLRNRDTSISRYGRNSYAKFNKDGYLSKNVRRMMPSQGVSLMVKPTVTNKVDEYMVSIFGSETYGDGAYNTYASIDDVIKNKRYFSEGKNGGYYIRNPFDPEAIHATYKPTKSEALAQMETWLRGRESDRVSYASSKVRSFRSAKAEGKKEMPNVKGNDSKVFNRYLRDDWELNDSLLDKGILIFYNDLSKNYEFVYVTKNDIARKVNDFAYENSKITGNLCGKRETKDYTMDAYMGNIDLMRLMFTVNEFISKLPEGYTISNMRVISQYESGVHSQPFNTLRDNFNQMVNLANRKKGLNITNNFEGEDAALKFEDNIVSVVNRINELEHVAGFNSSILKQLNESKSKLAQAKDMTNDMRQAAIIIEFRKLYDYITNKESDLKKSVDDIVANGGQDAADIFRLLADEIQQLQSMHMQRRLEDIEHFNVAKSDMVQSVNRSQVEQTKELNRHVLEEMNTRIRERMNDELADARVLVVDFMKAKKFVVGANNNYDHLIDRTNNNHRVIDPEQHPELTSTDRAFLNKWLKMINAIRHPSTKGDRNHPDAYALVANGEWFDIPLLDGGFLNQVKSSKGLWNGVKDYFKNVAKKAIDPLLYHEAGVNGKSDMDIKRSRLDTVQNPMNLNSDIRAEYIASQGVDMFSRDLGDILVMFTANDIIYGETNKMLPIMQAIGVSAYLDMKDSGISTERVCQHLVDRMRAEAYDINLDDNKLLRKYFAYVDGLGTKLLMAGNLVGGVRDTALGTYNVISRTFAKLGRQDMPSQTNVMKAYAYVTAKGLEGLANDNFLYALDRKFNMSGFGTRELHNMYKGEISPAGGNIFNGNLAMTTARIPDFIHRMTLTVAFMMEDGSFDAYSYDKERDRLVYDFSKDKRFNECVKKFKEGKPLSEGDKENLALYFTMLEEENTRLPEGQKKIIGDPLKEGISEHKLTSIRNMNNQLHGTMDRQNRSLLYRYFYGGVFLKFRSYLPSKITNAWTPEGHFQSYDTVKMIDQATGKQMYIARNEDGTIYYTSDTSDPKCTGIEALEQSVMLESGMWNDILSVIKIMCNKENRQEKWEEFKQNPYKMANLATGAEDLVALLLGLLVSGIFLNQNSEADRNKYVADLLYAGFVNPTTENSPFKLISDLMDVVDSPTVSAAGRTGKAFASWLVTDDYSTKSFLSRVSLTKPFAAVMD